MRSHHSSSLPTTLLLVLILLAACGGPATPDGSGRLNIAVSVAPQRYFVERIGGQRVQVSVMVGPGDEPHTYEPRPEQLKSLSTTHAYLSIGVEFEDTWLDRLAAVNPDMLVVDTTVGIQRTPLKVPHLHSADEPAEAEAAHGESELENPDPHIWLSPALTSIQAQTIYDTLAQIDPDHQDTYAANLERFLTDIDTLDRSIRDTLAELPVRKFMVFHPTWGYFARDYGLEMIPVEIGGQEPSAAEMAGLVDFARHENITVIFAQPELSTRAAETIASEIGGQVVLVNPLAADWADNLQRVADAFARALSS